MKGRTRADHIDMVGDVAEFMEKFGLLYDGPPRRLPEDIAQFRRIADEEELREYESAATMADQLDALVDRAYFLLGTALLHGYDFRTAWARVHAKNMEKVRVERAELSKRGSHYDVVKPDGWTPPDLSDLTDAWIDSQAHMAAAVAALETDSEKVLVAYEASYGTGEEFQNQVRVLIESGQVQVFEDDQK